MLIKLDERERGTSPEVEWSEGGRVAQASADECGLLWTASYWDCAPSPLAVLESSADRGRWPKLPDGSALGLENSRGVDEPSPRRLFVSFGLVGEAECEFTWAPTVIAWTSSALKFAKADPVLLVDEGPSPLLSAVPDEVLFGGTTTGSGIGMGAGLGTLLVLRGCIDSLLALLLVCCPSEDEEDEGRGSLVDDVGAGLLELLTGLADGGDGNAFVGNVGALSIARRVSRIYGQFSARGPTGGRKQGKDV